jgi:hypothetical protein
MARNLIIVPRIEVVHTAGLCCPPRRPYAHPFWWVDARTRRLPQCIRYSWCPVSGLCYAGLEHRHAEQIPPSTEYPFESFLRGFAFPIRRAIALRTFYWPEHAGDAWNNFHAELDARIEKVFLATLRPVMPRGIKVHHNVDNRFLRQTYFEISLFW